MTNGEKLCIDFPNMRYIISEHRVITTIGIAASFDLDWWNAEYKESTTPNDCETCIHNKGVLECDMYGCKYEPTAKNGISNKSIIYKAKESKEIQKDLDKLSELNKSTTKNEVKYCDRNICLKNEYNNIGCEDCEVTKSQEPTTKNNLAVDCISREQALNEFCIYNSYDSIGVDKVRSCLETLPLVTPIRPKGHWIPIYQGDEIIDYRCSECEFGNTFGKGTFGMNFCPRCGSDNSEVEE